MSLFLINIFINSAVLSQSEPEFVFPFGAMCHSVVSLVALVYDILVVYILRTESTSDLMFSVVLLFIRNSKVKDFAVTVASRSGHWTATYVPVSLISIAAILSPCRIAFILTSCRPTSKLFVELCHLWNIYFTWTSRYRWNCIRFCCLFCMVQFETTTTTK